MNSAVGNGESRNKGRKTSEWHRHYAMSGRCEDIPCWSNIFGMVFAARCMVLIPFFADRSVVGQTEPTVFVVTYFTCHQHQYSDVTETGVADLHVT